MRENVVSTLHINVSETNCCEILSLYKIFEKFALAPNWHGNRLLNTLIITSQKSPICIKGELTLGKTHYCHLTSKILFEKLEGYYITRNFI